MNRLMIFVVMILLGVFGSNSVSAEDHKHEFAADVKAFHDVLSPLWHSKAASPQREIAACAAAKDLDKRAGKIKSVYAVGLRESTKAFRKQCKKDSSQAAASFVALHDAFHHLIDHKN